jgi:predicted amidophosphoribosyltransferase
LSSGTVPELPKCPGCGCKYREINRKCVECMKRYNHYRYGTLRGMREQYEEEYGGNSTAGTKT